jgi:hypothetical protein
VKDLLLPNPDEDREIAICLELHGVRFHDACAVCWKRLAYDKEAAIVELGTEKERLKKLLWAVRNECAQETRPRIMVNMEFGLEEEA